MVVNVCVCVCVCPEQMFYLLIGYALTHILKVACDVLHCGVTQQDPSEVFLTDGGHSLGIAEELNLKDFCLQVVHESADRVWHTVLRGDAITRSVGH